MKLGTINLYKKWLKLKTIVGYQTPKKPSFFQYLILNTIATYPNKKKTLAEVLRTELKINDLMIYADCLKDLIERENIIAIDTNSSLQYVSTSYNNEWIDCALGVFVISREALAALERGILLSKYNNREALIDFVFDQFTDMLLVNNSTTNLTDKITEDDLVINAPGAADLMGNDLFNYLNEYKKNELKTNQFNKDTTFSFIKTNNTKIEITSGKITNLFNPTYEPVQINLAFTTFKDIKLKVENDKNLQNILDNNDAIKGTVVDYFLNKMTNDLKEHFNLNLSRLNINLFESNYLQDPRYITTTLANPRILIVNSSYVNENVVINKKYYQNNNLELIIFVNASQDTTLADLRTELPFFRISKDLVIFDHNFITLFINNKLKTEAYAIQETEIISLGKKILLANKYKDNYSKNILKEIMQYLNQKLIKYQGQLHELISSKKEEDLFIHFYLLDLINNNDCAFQNFMENQETEHFNNKTDLYLRWEEICDYLVLKPNYKNTIHNTLVADIKQLAHEQKSIVRSYSVLYNGEILSNKDILNTLQELYDDGNTTMGELYKLTKIATPSIVEKIWNQNLFNIVTKFIRVISQNIAREIIDLNDDFDVNTKNTVFLTNLYSYAKDYETFRQQMEYQSETNVLQRNWKALWEKINLIKARLTSFQNSSKLIIQLLHSLSVLELKFCQLKHGEVFNSEVKFNDYMNLCEFGKASVYVLNKLKGYVDEILVVDDYDVKYLNEKIFLLKPNFEKSKYKKLNNWYNELKLYVYCEEYRNEQNDNKNREQIKKILEGIEEVFA